MDSHDDYAPGQWLSLEPGDHIREPRGAPADVAILAECVLRDLVRARDDLDALGNEAAAELVALALEKLDPAPADAKQLRLAIGG